MKKTCLLILSVISIAVASAQEKRIYQGYDTTTGRPLVYVDTVYNLVDGTNTTVVRTGGNVQINATGGGSTDTAQKTIAAAIGVGTPSFNSKGLYLKSSDPATSGSQVRYGAPFFMSGEAWKANAPANSWPLLFRTRVEPIAGGTSSVNGQMYLAVSQDSGQTWQNIYYAGPFLFNFFKPIGGTDASFSGILTAGGNRTYFNNAGLAAFKEMAFL